VKPVVLFGTGDFARVAHVYLRDDSPYEIAAFTVHGEYADADSFAGLPLVPFEELDQRHPPDAYDMLVAVGFSKVNRARAAIYDECKARGYELISYVNSRAMVSAETRIGDNCFVFEANVVQPFVSIGDDVVLWSGNHIGHDVTIGDHCFIASHVVVSGNVKIGERCFVGVNATFRDGITVAPDCVIGAGAAIMKDTIPGGVYAAARTDPRDVRSWDLERF
jgi:sugar O-acyltransferase (sialic acid O-acetyltransferase NeuD family)